MPAQVKGLEIDACKLQFLHHENVAVSASNCGKHNQMEKLLAMPLHAAVQVRPQQPDRTCMNNT